MENSPVKFYTEFWIYTNISKFKGLFYKKIKIIRVNFFKTMIQICVIINDSLCKYNIFVEPK